jgi:hypothetical protein
MSRVLVEPLSAFVDRALTTSSSSPSRARNLPEPPLSLLPEVSMLERFQAGGFGMIPTLLFGFFLVAVSVRYATNPTRRLVPLLFALGILTLSAGALGFVVGFIKSVSAVAESSGDRPVLALLGAGEAANCIALALLLVTLASIAASAGALRIARRATDTA